MMRRILLAISLALGGAIFALRVPVSASTTHFQQWIAPLECVESHIVDGENTTIILSPQQCDDLLHPPKHDHGGGKPHPGKTPHAPDTGSSEMLVFAGFTISLFLLLGTATLIGDARLRKRIPSGIIAIRVSSSRICKNIVYKLTAVGKKTR